MKYRVSGQRAVANVKPGGTVEIAEGSPLNVAALVASGHLTPVPLRAEHGPELDVPLESGRVVRRQKKDD